MKYKTDLLAIGHTALDYIIQVNEFPQPNTATTINRMKTFFGGAAANVAVVGSKLGIKASLVSAVGGEFLESSYSNYLKDLGIDIQDMILVEGDKNPTAFVLTNERDDQIFYFYWGAASQFKKTKPPKRAIENAQAVHLATGDPRFNWRCGKLARNEAKLISFDPGQDLHMYSPQELEDVLRICDILFGNHHEIERILEILHIDLQDLREIGPHMVVKTLGKDGSVIYAGNNITIKAIKRNPVDPTGAGDSYRAGFLKAYLEGKDLETCGNFASAVASFVVEKEGCQTNVPTYDMAMKRMEEAIK